MLPGAVVVAGLGLLITGVVESQPSLRSLGYAVIVVGAVIIAAGHINTRISSVEHRALDERAELQAENEWLKARLEAERNERTLASANVVKRPSAPSNGDRPQGAVPAQRSQESRHRKHRFAVIDGGKLSAFVVAPVVWSKSAAAKARHHLVGVAAATSMAVAAPFAGPAVAQLVDMDQQPPAQAASTLLPLFDGQDREYLPPVIDPDLAIAESVVNDGLDDGGDPVDDATVDDSGDESRSQQPRDVVAVNASSDGDESSEFTLVDEARTNARAEFTATPEPDPKPEPKPEPDPSPAPEPSPDPEPEPGPGPAPEPTDECKPDEGLVVTVLGLVCQLLTP